MFDDDGCGLEDFLLIGGIYLFADYMEQTERELAAEDLEYAANEDRSLGWGCLITIGIFLGVFLLTTIF